MGGGGLFCLGIQEGQVPQVEILRFSGGFRDIGLHGWKSGSGRRSAGFRPHVGRADSLENVFKSAQKFRRAATPHRGVDARRRVLCRIFVASLTFE